MTLTPERPLSRRHLVEQGAECEDVGARVRLPAFELLGGHVLQRPEDGALPRQRRAVRRGDRHPRNPNRCMRSELRQAEVEQLDAAPGEHDVRGLQIPMDDRVSMCLVERVGDLNRVPKRLVERQCAFLQAFSQRLPFEVLHDEVVDAVLLTNIMERADMRVIQRRDGAGFALEAFAELRIRCNVRGQDFDRDGAIEASVAGFVDFTHAPRTNGREDLVGAET